MKIAWIVNNITIVGGVERVVIQLSNYLVKHNIQVEIISLFSESGNPYFECDNDVIITHEAGGDSSYRGYLRLIRRSLGKTNSEIVIGTQEYINASLAVLPHKRKKIILTQHTTNSYSKAHFKMNCLLAKFVSRYVVLTNCDKEEYDNKHIKNCIVIANAIPTVGNQVSCLTEKQIIGVGRLTEVKDFDKLVKAFNIVHKHCPEWKLLILGGGECRSQLEELISAYELKDYINLPGFKKNVGEYMLQSSIFVSSSRSEGFGMVFLEAMEKGLPIISYDISSAKELLDEGKFGYLVEERTPEMLADAIIKMINDENMRKEYADKSRIRIQDYTIDIIGNSWISLFNEL